MKVFEYVIYTTGKKKNGAEAAEPAEIHVGPHVILAGDEDLAYREACRYIPEEFASDAVEVVVRPFC